jgi:hypothetical protein
VHAQTLVSVGKMATECTIEEQRFVVRFSVSKWTHCKGYSYGNVSSLRWEVFVASSGSYLGGKHFAGDEEVETEVRKQLSQQPKDFCVAGFEALVKRCDKFIYVCGGMPRNKMPFPSYTFLSICDLFTDSSSYVTTESETVANSNKSYINSMKHSGY